METISIIFRREASFRALLTAVLLLLSAVPTAAQFKLIVSPPLFTNYPEIEIPFQVLDNTSSVDTITMEDFLVTENTVRMLPLEVECGDVQIAPKIYFYFLIDVSFSMGFREDTTLFDVDSVKWRTAKQVFIDAFSRLRPQDEGALGSFARTFIQEQEYTSSTRQLVDAASGMFLRSGTAIYDAIQIAASISDEKEGKKVIILLTDGVDNSSQLTREAAIAYAWNRGIPVYPIGLGLYFDPEQPNRVDEDTLRRIATGTGGKAYFAPTSEDLAQIFGDIIESIYSIGCVLRYTTLDTCRDGSRRDVLVQANLAGQVITERFSYTLPDLRSRLHLSLDLPVEALQAGQRYEIPVLADGEIRTGQPIWCDATLKFDPALIEIRGIAQTSSVLDPADITMTEVAPGEMRFTTNGALPQRGIPYATDVLFALDMRVRNRETVAETYFDLTFGSGRQICDIVPSATSSPAVVHACPASVVAGFDTTIVAIPGHIVEIPILLDSDIDFNQTLQYAMSVDFDADLFRYEGYELRGTISEDLDVSVLPGSASLHIRAEEGMPRDTGRTLVILRFYTSLLRTGRPVALRLRDASLSQRGIGIIAEDCVPKLILVGERLFADGICQPLVRRRQDLRLGANSPNPVSASGGQTRFEYFVTGTAPVHMEIVDEFGRTCAVLVDGYLEKGSHEVVWKPGQLPSGVYLCILSEGGEVRTRKVLVTQ